MIANRDGASIQINMEEQRNAETSPTGKIGQSALSAHFANSRQGDGKIVLEWSNLSFSMLVKDTTKSKPCAAVMKRKDILKNVSGRTESGELLAIMGPTGCGKTSLLNILAARVPDASAKVSSLTGKVKVNGENRNESKFRSISAYVLQDDNLYPHLTVLETLTLAVTFFLPSTTTDAEKASLVDACIAELGLVKARDTCIGNDKVRGVSGGERKRASVAVQLISDPAVLFLDEPTSGLDSFQALSVMESMKDLAMNGRLVISVIHQPRSSIFSMFDRLLLLSEGRTMYSGPASEATDYFSLTGFRCSSFFNPSDFFLDLLSPDNRDPESEEISQARIKRLGDAWYEREVETLIKSNSEGNLAKLVEEAASSGEVRSVGTSGDFKKGIKNLQVLCWRAYAEQTRDFGTIIFKLVLTTFFALIIGGIYSNIGFNQLSIQNRNGILFFISINIAFNNLIGVLNTFPREKVIVNRERASRAYDTFSYFFAKVVIEIPLNILPALVYSCIVYWLVGLRPAGFGYFILIVMFEAIVAISLGLGISAAAPSVEFANAFGPILMIIGILFGGFYIDIGSLPIVANWIPYFSMFRWTFEALCVNEYTGLTFTCDGAGR